MASSGIQSQIMGVGLRKALVAECRDVLTHYLTKIDSCLSDVPEHKQGWRKGSYSWFYVSAVEHWTTYFFYDLELMAMARGKQNDKKKASLADYSFVRCELTSEDKKAAKIWIEANLGDMAAIAHDVVSSEYKMSVSFSSEHDTFTASLTGKEDAVNAFKTLTARHKDWTIAVMTVLYKHAVMFGSKVWESEDTDNDGWS